MCVFYGLYCITGVWFPRHRLLQLRNSSPENDSFFCQIVPKIAGNHTYCLALIKFIYRSDSYQPLECWSRTLSGSEFAHHCVYIWLTRSNTRLKVFVHRLSTYQWFYITLCWQKYIIHESDVIWAPRRLKLPVTRLFVQKFIRAKMK